MANAKLGEQHDQIISLFITKNSEDPGCPSTIGNGMMRKVGSLDNDPS
ncbi:hypothetical protein [Anabaena sp. UHCC 0204]|nr:hypothetical protein [Anabaena sp. UHCC 0204]